MVNKKKIYSSIKKETSEIIKCFNQSDIITNKNFYHLCARATESIKKGGKIIFYGNGGSAADAQHLATELVVRYKKKRPSLPAISLVTDTSIITATANDINFDSIFSRQIEGIGNPGDISIAITTSGNSKNLIKAAKICKKKHIETFCFSGNKGGKLKKYVDYPIIINSNKTSVIQVMEISIGQIFCEILENYFYEK